jgi:hypothetical protein
LGRRSGHPRHGTLLALRPHLTSEDATSLAQGYGMFLGADAVADARNGVEVLPHWNSIAERLGARETIALLIGVGCGGTSSAELPPPVVGAWVPAVSDQEHILYGLGLCTAQARRRHSPNFDAARSALTALSPVGWQALGEGLRDGGLQREDLSFYAQNELVLERLASGFDAAARRPEHRSTVSAPGALLPPRW